jgi:signal transduction histidine kinase
MLYIRRAAEWPITVKVPVIVMVLMLAISFVISNTVLRRLADTQERHLQALSNAYIDGLGVMLLPSVLRRDVWEVFDALDRARSAHAGLNATHTVVLDAGDLILAASQPKAFPTGQQLGPRVLGSIIKDGELRIDEAKQIAYVLAPMKVQARAVGSIYTEFDISALVAERRAVLWQLIATNSLLTILLMAIGYWAVRRMVEPVRMLGAYLDRATGGTIELIPENRLGPADAEFGRLFRRYNAMARAANERLLLAEQLAEKERLASLGQLASGMAHEINNPLGGLFNALDAIKRYGDREPVRDTSIRLLERGLIGIRDVVRATLMTYRKPDDRRDLKHDDIEDLRYLIQPALHLKKLTLEWSNGINRDAPLPAAYVRDATLNLLLNACAASPAGTTILFRAVAGEESLDICVGDSGGGLPEPYRRFLEGGDPANGPPLAGGGLGVWIVRRLLDAVSGSARVEIAAMGTEIHLRFPVAPMEARHVA